MTSAHVAIVDLQLGRLPRRCLVTGESTDNLVKRRLYAALPGARSGVRRQTIWLTRVHPDAAAEIDRWMATWAPPPPDDPAQLGWGAPTARG